MDNFYRQLNHWLYPSYLSNERVRFGMKALVAISALASLTLVVDQANAATAAFDLACTGKSGREIQFRFDLSQRKWCFGRCDSAWSINELSDSIIRVSTYSSADANWTIIINRYTSKFYAIHRGHGDKPADSGTCKAAPFSGFPTKKF